MPIAIGGCGSSGTSLLRRILNAHSEIACGEEMSAFDRPNMYEITLDELHEMYRSQDFTALDDMPFPMVLEDGSSYFGLRKGNNGESYNGVPETNAIFAEAKNVADFWNRYFTHAARKQGKRRWAEKTPGNIYCAKQFLEMYPGGRFIHVIRDGRDVCLSLMDRRDFRPPTAMLRWIACMEAGLEVRDHNRLHEVRYENLVHEPRATLQRLFSRLQIEYEPSVLDYHKENITNRYGYATTPIHTKSVGRWEKQKDQLVPGLRRSIELGLRRYLRLMNYPV